MTQEQQLSQFETVFSLLGAPIHIFSKSGRGVIGGKIQSPAALQRWVRAASRPEDFYVCLNPSATNRIKPRIEDITAFKWWLLDLDPIDDTDGNAFDTIYVTDALQEMFGFCPTFYRVWSGRGRQMWIPVSGNAPLPLAQLLVKGCTEELVRRIGPRLRGLGMQIDMACAEVSHLARLPGTINTKTDKEAHIIAKPGPGSFGRTIQPVDMAQYIAPAPPEPPCYVDALMSSNSLLAVHNVWRTMGWWNTLTPYNRAFIQQGTNTAIESRHRRATATARQLRDIGCDKTVAGNWLLDGAALCTPRLDSMFINRLIKETFK